MIKKNRLTKTANFMVLELREFKAYFINRNLLKHDSVCSDSKVI